MDSDRHLELDISSPAWSEAPGEVLKAVFDGTPGDVTVNGAGAGAPSAITGQLLAFVRRHVESGGGTFAVSDPSPALVEGLALLGLKQAIFGTEEIQQ